jgi:hypothetical protein
MPRIYNHGKVRHFDVVSMKPTMSLVQIPFDGLKSVSLAKSISYELYKAINDDNPICGLPAVDQGTSQHFSI